MLHLASNEGYVVLPVDRRISIVPCTMGHVGDLADTLRIGDLEEIAAQCLPPRTIIRRSLKGSIWCRTYLYDGQVAAMMGLGGSAIGDLGLPWLLTSASVERTLPRVFVIEAKKAVEIMLSMKPRLENHVLASYGKACRLLEILGFKLDEPVPYGPRGVMFRRFHIGF